MTEEAMLKGCIRNQAAAQQELYYRYSPKMLSVCYRYAKSREDAEDMLQEGFIKIFGQLRQFQNRGALEGWIRKIIVHTCINNLKKNKKFTESVDLIHASGVHIREESVPSIVQAKQVVECIRMLPIGIALYSTFMLWKAIRTGKLQPCLTLKKAQAVRSIQEQKLCWKTYW